MPSIQYPLISRVRTMQSEVKKFLKQHGMDLGLMSCCVVNQACLAFDARNAVKLAASMEKLLGTWDMRQVSHLSTIFLCARPLNLPYRLGTPKCSQPAVRAISSSSWVQLLLDMGICHQSPWEHRRSARQSQTAGPLDITRKEKMDALADRGTVGAASPLAL